MEINSFAPWPLFFLYCVLYHIYWLHMIIWSHHLLPTSIKHCTLEGENYSSGGPEAAVTKTCRCDLNRSGGVLALPKGFLFSPLSPQLSLPNQMMHSATTNSCFRQPDYVLRHMKRDDTRCHGEAGWEKSKFCSIGGKRRGWELRGWLKERLSREREREIQSLASTDGWN